MNHLADRRDTRRVITGREFGISFTLKGRPFRDVRIANLSVGGCLALVGAWNAGFFQHGAALGDLVLLHPELPKDPIIATVAFVLGGRTVGQAQEMVGVGIHFLCMEASTREALEIWVGAARDSQQA
ncbi:MAG TPA: hypothetical protein VGK03_05520 [Geothrix sp.]|jgi:hypothetical protein